MPFVIPRKGEALTWESPGTILEAAQLFVLREQEIATSPLRGSSQGQLYFGGSKPPPYICM